MIIIDGSFGEGGGQILRSSLALSLCTGQAFCIENIRAGRKKPGLMRQHLTAVRAAVAVGGASAEGDAIGSTQLTFTPAPGNVIRGGDYRFAVGTAGSTTLVLQTVLPALLTASGPSTLTLEGGTHNPFAPPFDFLNRAFLPLVNRMGPKVTAILDRPGFYPAGGGQITVHIEPAGQLQPLNLLERGTVQRNLGRAVVANLPRHIAEREIKVIGRKLNWSAECLRVEEMTQAQGPGNMVTIELEYEHVTEVFTGFGEHDRSAEAVAEQAVQPCQRYLGRSAPAGEYLTDQLLLPMALAEAGAFRSTGLSRHATTHIELISKFLNTVVKTETLGNRDVLVTLGAG